jgi:general nucleoside transport system ATP-binding protein
MTAAALKTPVRVAKSLETTALSKHFGAFKAMDDISLRIEAGSFHALLGENGAGKSTFVKCVIGYQAPSSGDVLLDGHRVSFQSPKQAHAAGIGMVYQRFTVVEQMTVAENLVLARDDIPRVIDWKRELRELEAFMDGVPFRLPLQAEVHSLAAGQKQKLEILKQLYLKRSLLFLDEPTSVLTPNEADEVLGLLHAMTQRKELTVLLITHKFRELQQFGDHVSVLRRGKLTGSAKYSDVDMKTLSSWMIGDERPRSPAPRKAVEERPARLRIDKLCADDDLGVPAVRELSLCVAPGEIVGVAGVSGNGQKELVEVIAGQRIRTGGSVQIGERTYLPSRSFMRELRISIIPEVPLDNATVPGMSLSENLALRSFDEPPICTGGTFISRKALHEQATTLTTRFGVRAPGLDAPMRALSGGNVQRAVLARELSREPEVLIVQNPCFGLDMAASAEIRAKLVDARNRGCAVLLLSEDLDELLELSDRMCVIFHGNIVHEGKPGDTPMSEIGQLMAGALRRA